MLSLASTLLLIGPLSAAAAQLDAPGRRQQQEELPDTATNAQRDVHELRIHMDELDAETIDRGLLLTLEDTEFTTNSASLSGIGHRRLNTLASFLKRYPQRSVTIHGYAGAGNFRYDQALTKHRADAVKAHLVGQGISKSRITAPDAKEISPDLEDAATELPVLRRVEVIIEDPLTSAQSSM